MELTFESDESLITAPEKIKCRINNDEIIYYPEDYELDEITIIHISQLAYGYIFIQQITPYLKKIKLIIPCIVYEIDDIMLNKCEFIEMKDMRLFIRFYNYNKYRYQYNMECLKLENKLQKSINSKELFLNMSLYVTNKYFIELSKQMLKYQKLFSSFTDTINNILLNKNYSIINDILKIDNDKPIAYILQNFYKKIYDDLIIKEQSKIQKESGEKINNIFKNNCIYTCNEFQLEKIDKLKEYFINLIRILNELKRTYYERMISGDYDICDVYKIEKDLCLNKLDILTRFLYVRFGQFNDWKKVDKINKILIQENSEIQKQNKKLLLNLKYFIVKNNYQLYICFRCGNILQKTNKQISTCNVDNKCFSTSYFYCKKCCIHFCSYCINYPLNLKCIYNHTLTKNNIDNDEKAKCDLCNKIDSQNKFYYCEKCDDVFLCEGCYEETTKKKNLMNYKCCFCGEFLFWRRGLKKKCNKCEKVSNCFWFCFFCKKYFCIKCYYIKISKCGLMHQLKEIYLDAYKTNNNFQTKTFHDLITNNILLTRTNCDICKNIFFSRFFYCARCNLIKCLNCN